MTDKLRKPTHQTVYHEDGTYTQEPLPQHIADGIGKVIDELNSIQPLDPLTERYHCSPTMGCGREITRKEMIEWDRDTVTEFNKLRWCKECQDKFFNDDEEPDVGTWADGTPVPEEATIMHCICDSADVGIGVIYEMREDCPFHGRKP